MATNLFFCDVEAGHLFKLNGVKAKKLIKQHPNWYDYDMSHNDFEYINNYFKMFGELIGDTRERNLFVGFTA